MDILEENGLRGTFFIEVLATHVVPDSQLADAYRQIVRRGHDAQLHLHPVYHYFRLFRQGRITRQQLPPTMDLIGSLSIETQVELLQEGCRLFRGFVGKGPIAFRAGCFGGSPTTLAALAKLSFRYDSSFNAAYLGKQCLMDGVAPSNAPWRDGSIWEVPVTNFETGVWKLRGLKPLDIGAVSLLEMQRVLNEVEALGIGVVVFIMHWLVCSRKRMSSFRIYVQID